MHPEPEPRNQLMVERIERTPVAYPFRFVVAGDSGAFADPTADGIFAALLRPDREARSAPIFFANLDFACGHTRFVVLHPQGGVDGEVVIQARGRRRTHGVRLLCCAHGLAFDRYVHDGIEFVMSGGGGTGLCSHYRGVCTEGPGRPEDRGAVFHAVEIAISEAGDVSGRVIQAFDRAGARTREFGELLL